MSDRTDYIDNLSRRYNTSKEQYNAPEKEKPSKRKLELLNNGFPVALTDGEFIYDIVVNENCDIVFKNGIHTRCYADVSNKFVDTLRVIR